MHIRFKNLRRNSLLAANREFCAENREFLALNREKLELISETKKGRIFLTRPACQPYRCQTAM
jgi:hypothetical protein